MQGLLNFLIEFVDIDSVVGAGLRNCFGETSAGRARTEAQEPGQNHSSGKWLLLGLSQMMFYFIFIIFY